MLTSEETEPQRRDCILETPWKSQGRGTWLWKAPCLYLAGWVGLHYKLGPHFRLSLALLLLGNPQEPRMGRAEGKAT